MSTIGHSLPSPGWVGDRTRIAGSVYLGLAGLVNVVTGLWLLTVAGSAWTTRFLIDVFVGSLGELGGLYRGDLIQTLTAWVLPVLGVVFVVVAVVQLYTAWRAYTGRNCRRAVVASIVGSLNPAAFPPGLVAVVLLVASRHQFEPAGDPTSA